MKKLFITLLAVFYLGVSSGPTLHFHYCMGKLIDWGIAHKQAKECSNCGMEKNISSNCCKDQHAKFDAENAQKISRTTYDFSQTIIAVPVIAFHELGKINHYPVYTMHLSGHSPPRTASTPVFIRHCTFRI